MRSNGAIVLVLCVVVSLVVVVPGVKGTPGTIAVRIAASESQDSSYTRALQLVKF